MYNFKIINECYLCGNDNSEIGNICLKCKNDSVLIDTIVCKSCGLPLVSEKYFCMRCRDLDYSFESNRSLFEYKNTAKEIFYQYKFKRHKKVACWYAEMLSQKIKKEYEDYLVVPSPYKYWKKVKKGWDQVESITNILKKKYGIRVISALQKKGTLDQKKLDLLQRKINLKGKIKFQNSIRIIGEKILLIDDIFTTGATADECSTVLIENGAESVKILTIAID